MLYILNATGRLTKYEDEIRNIINESIERYASIHVVKKLDIIVAENAAMTIPEHGVGGYTATAHEIYISLDLDHADIALMIREHIGPTVAHELTHIVRLQEGSKLAVDGTLGDNVIGEGLADNVSVSLYPSQDTPWIKSLSNEDFEKMKTTFIAKYDHLNYNHSAWFYGSKEENIPRWSGYHLGYALVGDYLKAHTDLKIKDLVTLETKELMSIWL